MTFESRSEQWITLASGDAVRVLRFLGQRFAARLSDVAGATGLDPLAVDAVVADLNRHGVVVSRRPHEWSIDRAALQRLATETQTEFGLTPPTPTPPWSTGA